MQSEQRHGDTTGAARGAAGRDSRDGGPGAPDHDDLAAYFGGSWACYRPLVSPRRSVATALLNFGWAPFLFDIGWLVHRRLYAEAGGLVAVGIVTAAFAPSPWLPWLALKVILGLWGRDLDIRHARRQIARLKQSAPGERRPRVAALGRAGRGGAVIAVSLLLWMVALIEPWAESTPSPACDDFRVHQRIVAMVRDRLPVSAAEYFHIQFDDPQPDAATADTCTADLIIGDDSRRGAVFFAASHSRYARFGVDVTFAANAAMPSAFAALLEGPTGAVGINEPLPTRIALIATALAGAFVAGFVLFLAVGNRGDRRWFCDAVGCGALSTLAVATIGAPGMLATRLVPDWAMPLGDAFLAAGLAEESAKLYVLVALALAPITRDGERGTRTAWIAAGAAIALGFAVTENLIYALFSQTDLSLFEAVLLRVAAAIPGHVADGTLMGFICWLCRGWRTRNPLWWMPALAVAALSHGAFDFPILALDEVSPPLELAWLGPVELASAIAAVQIIGFAATASIVMLARRRDGIAAHPHDLWPGLWVALAASVMTAIVLAISSASPPLVESSPLGRGGELALAYSIAFAPLVASCFAWTSAWQSWRARLRLRRAPTR